MKDAEKAIIENLRKTTLSHLSEYNYDVVIKEIEKYGITNLTGTTEKLVRDAVIKHGSHNQKTHGRGGKGGSGGGAAPASPKEMPTKRQFNTYIDNEASAVVSVINDLSQDVQGTAEGVESAAELKEISEGVKLLDEASKLAGKVKTIKEPKAKLDQLDRVNFKLSRAYEKINTGREEKLLEDYLQDGLDFVDQIRDEMAGGK